MRAFTTTALALSLGACTPSTQGVFEKSCAALTTGYSVFTQLKATGRFSQSTVNKVETAWTVGSALCQSPPQNVADAAVKVAFALAVVSQALGH